MDASVSDALFANDYYHEKSTHTPAVDTNSVIYRGLAAVVALLWSLIRVLRALYDRVIHAIFAAYYSSRMKTALPPVFNTVLLLSASQLAKRIRERTLSSSSVVRAFVQRSRAVNAQLNAVVQDVFDRALEEAAAVDKRIAQGYEDGSLSPELLERTEPLLGVPFTVKESIAVAGLVHSSGLVSRRHTLAAEDSEVVANIKRAGAILIATTNGAELGLWWECDNLLYGKTNNPYDLNRTSGGSSGGECALMSACGTPLSLGSDVGGSVRIPANFCGLFAHKPTAGYVSTRGVGLANILNADRILTAGPITRHAEDLLPLLRVLGSPSTTVKLDLHLPVNLANVRVFSIADDSNGVMTSPVCKELRDVQEAVGQYLQRAHGITVIKLRLTEFQNSFEMWLLRLEDVYKGQPKLKTRLANCEGEINLWTELVKAALGRSQHTWPPLIQAALQIMPKKRKDHFHSSLIALLEKLQDQLGSSGVLLYPSHPTLAPHHKETLAIPFNFAYTAIFNALGLPATQVPLGLAANGLPLGIQVVGALNMDRLTVAVATELEKGFGGWRCPVAIL